MMPASTSPLPAVDIPGFPVGFTMMCPSGAAVRVGPPFSTSVARCSFEKREAQVNGSSHIRDLVCRPPKFVYEDTSLRQAAEHMANHGIGRLPVMSRANPPQLVGILTRSDVVNAFRRTADQHRRAEPTIRFGAASRVWRNGRKSSVG